MYSPDSIAPSPVTCTDPVGELVHPRPDDTCAGTARSTVPAGIPLFVASGNPQVLGAAAHSCGTGAK